MKLLLTALAGEAFSFSISESDAGPHSFQLNLNSGADLSNHLLKNEDVFIHSDGERFSAADGTLQLVGGFRETMTDKLGRHQLIVNKYSYRLALT